MYLRIINYEIMEIREFILSIKNRIGIILVTNRYINITNIIKVDIDSKIIGN
jgi:hypothetical protein